jgi:predicted PurR-regulated permease PerM
MTFYERHYFVKSPKNITLKSKKPVCLTFAIITLVAVGTLIIGLVVPQLVSCIELIIAELPSAINKVIAWINSLNIVPDDIMSMISSIDWKSRIGQIAEMLTSGIGSVMDVVIGAVTSVVSGVVTAIIGIIFGIYLLISKDKLSNQFCRISSRYLKKDWNEKIRYVISIIDDSFHRYIVGQCTEAVILGLLRTVGMLILKLPYAPMIGAFIAFTALIPIAGAYIGAAVGAFIILMESPVKALVFLIFIIILQQVEGNLIYPKVVGSSMGLPGIWVLAAITIGGGVMGITGILISVPIAATIYKLIKNDLLKRESKEKQAEIINKEKGEQNG